MEAQSGVVGPVSRVGFAINPLDEAMAYETLMAIEGVTESRLAKEFPVAGFMGKPQSLVSILDTKRQNGQREQIDRTHAQVVRHLREIEGFSICTPGDFHYKPGLNDAKNPLRLFYYRGDINLLDSPCVSVVGARQATQTGLDMAGEIAGHLAENDFTLVSGLARGVDTAALRSAIDHRGRVIAVIGTPIDQYYPSENRPLQDEIANRHLLISQVPFYRYSKESLLARRAYFPRRNVTMSAMSLATVIVEASEGSGTLYQARAAIRQGRQLFIAGSCFNSHDWPQRFAGQGAIRFDSVDQITAQIKQIEPSREPVEAHSQASS